jgi:NADH-quinone oxidoreductase subunit N
VIAAFLYLRIVVTMYVIEEPATDGAPALRVAPGAALAVAVTVLVTLGFGILPDPAVNVARDAVPVLVASP